MKSRPEDAQVSSTAFMVVVLSRYVYVMQLNAGKLPRPDSFSLVSLKEKKNAVKKYKTGQFVAHL